MEGRRSLETARQLLESIDVAVDKRARLTAAAEAYAEARGLHDGWSPVLHEYAKLLDAIIPAHDEISDSVSRLTDDEFADAVILLRLFTETALEQPDDSPQ